MEIVFHNEYSNTLDVYTVKGIIYNTDEEGIPVDIQINASEATLIEIANSHCTLGCNFNEERDWMLFGRLDKFYIRNALCRVYPEGGEY